MLAPFAALGFPETYMHFQTSKQLPLIMKCNIITVTTYKTTYMNAQPLMDLVTQIKLKYLQIQNKYLYINECIYLFINVFICKFIYLL